MKLPSSKSIPVGFEFQPIGQLLTQLLDFEVPLGTAYERCIGYEKDFHVHDRLNLAFPRGSSRIVFGLENGERLSIDAGSFLWLPAGVSHRQDVKSTVYDNLALFPDENALAQATADLATLQAVPELPAQVIKAARTTLLHELLDRFFFERIVRRKPAEVLNRLGGQILEEVIRIVTSGVPSTETGAGISEDTAVVRAVQYLESHLFEEVATEDLAHAARTSGATLFRQFRKAVGMTPGEYLRKRRLDEARHLLRTGDYAVSDVALLVGYDDVAAFSKAFKRAFQVSPSELLASKK